jgi:hypothetical protein
MFLSTVVVYLRQSVVRLVRRRGGVTTAPLLQGGERSCSHAIIHWDALQQELARLWSLSAALLPVEDRKAHFSARLESALQVFVSGLLARFLANCSDPLLCPLSFDYQRVLALLLSVLNWEDWIRFPNQRDVEKRETAFPNLGYVYP